MRRWIFYLMALSLSGCAPWVDIQNVEPGMSKAEVLQQMGNPTDASGNDNGEYLYYVPANRFWERYYIHLVNGKVESYGQLGAESGQAQ